MVKGTNSGSKTSAFALFVWHSAKFRREMERLYQQNQRIMHRNEQLLGALRNLATEIAPDKKRELEELIMVQW